MDEGKTHRTLLILTVIDFTIGIRYGTLQLEYIEVTLYLDECNVARDYVWSSKHDFIKNVEITTYESSTTTAVRHSETPLHDETQLHKTTSSANTPDISAVNRNT